MEQNPWSGSDVPRGALYDRRFEELAAVGKNIHGEADLVDSYGPGPVLDAGCGTGRLAIELSRRAHRTVGVDRDAGMLDAARQKAPDLVWVEGDLADPELVLAGPFDTVVMAGNVLIFVNPGTEGLVITNMARRLRPGGRLVAGYSLAPGGLDVGTHDALAAASGLVLEDRWSTWERGPFNPASNYAVSVHRLAR